MAIYHHGWCSKWPSPEIIGGKSATTYPKNNMSLVINKQLWKITLFAGKTRHSFRRKVDMFQSWLQIKGHPPASAGVGYYIRGTSFGNPTSSRWWPLTIHYPIIIPSCPISFLPIVFVGFYLGNSIGDLDNLYLRDFIFTPIGSFGPMNL